MIHQLENMTLHSENGEIHRLDGPAIMTDNIQEWCKNKLYHREDGPARMFKAAPSGQKFWAEWWIDGKYIMSGQIIDMKQWDAWWVQ